METSPTTDPADWLAANASWVAAAAATVLLLSRSATRNVLSLLVRFVVALATLKLEASVWRDRFGRPVPLPRDLDEVMADPERLVRLLKKRGRMPADVETFRIERLASITTEPDKNRTAGSVRVSWGDRVTGDARALNVFLKFQTGRGLPMWLQALRIGAEPGVCREVDFYAKARASVPLRTLAPLLAEKLPRLNYVLVGLEYVDLRRDARVVTDSQGANLVEVEAVVRAAAKMHRAFSGGRAGEDPATCWIPARAGLDYLKFVDAFMDKTDPHWTPALWAALKAYFHSRPVTLVHGDCRVGNHMFVPHAPRDRVDEVVFADWEAVNIAPQLWDLTYCATLSWPAKARREHLDGVLGAYLEALADAEDGSNDDAVKLWASAADAKVEVGLLTLVLCFYSRTVRHGGFWRNQGNTSDDQRCWLVRLFLAVADLDAGEVARALDLDAGAGSAAIEALQDGLRAELERVDSRGVRADEL